MAGGKKRAVIIKLVVCLFIFTMAVTPLSGTEQSRTERAGPEAPSLRVGVIPHTKPYCYTSESGAFAGYNVDVMSAMSLELGVNIEFVEINDREVILSMIQNKVDAVLGADYTHVLPEYIAALEPFMQNKISVFVPRHDSALKGFDDLAGKKVSIYKDDPYLKVIQNIAGARVFMSDNIETAVEMLLAGLTDAYVGDKLTGTDYLAYSSYSDMMKTIGDRDCFWMTTLITMRKKDELAGQLREAYRRLQTKGTMDTIQGKWFGRSIEDGTLWLKRFAFFLFVAALIIAAVFTVFYHLNRLLKKQVEERTVEIREEKNLKEAIIDSLFEGLIYISANGLVVSANPAACFILEVESLVGRAFFQIPECSCFNLDISGKQSFREAAVKLGLREKYIEYSVTSVVKEGGAPGGMTLSFRDVTAERALRHKLLAKDKLETMGRLTAGIAHELRNPLTSIGMYMKLLPSKVDNEAFRRQLAEDIPREIGRLDDIIKSLLDYARPIPAHRERLNLAGEIEGTTRLLAPQLKEHDITLHCDIPAGVHIFFDRQQFRQVLLNIVINAVEVLGQVNSPDRSIHIAGRRMDGAVKIEIWDNGTGIPEQTARQIFEPFYSTKAEGHGLGLSIVEQLVRENAAEIMLDTTYTCGAKFVITAPPAVTATGGFGT